MTSVTWMVRVSPTKEQPVDEPQATVPGHVPATSCVVEHDATSGTSGDCHAGDDTDTAVSWYGMSEMPRNVYMSTMTTTTSTTVMAV